MPVVSTAAPRCTASGCNLIHTSDTEESLLGFASLLLGGGSESENIPCTSLHGCVDLLLGCYVKPGRVVPLFVCSLNDAWNCCAAPVMMISAGDTLVKSLHWEPVAKMLWSMLWKHAGTKRAKQFLGNWRHTMPCYKHASIIVTLKYYWRCLPQITHHQQQQALTTWDYSYYYY